MTCNPASILAEGRHRYVVRVYYEDTDAGGVVYHANYLRFAERARTESLRAMGVPHADMLAGFGLIYVVRRIKLDYVAPARLDDSLAVTTEVLAVGGASMALRQSFAVMLGEGAERLCAVLDVSLATVRVADQRAARMPARWREALEAMAVAAGRSVASRGD
jgi:acyl-CoA thioester hydrolase